MSIASGLAPPPGSHRCDLAGLENSRWSRSEWSSQRVSTPTTTTNSGIASNMWTAWSTSTTRFSDTIEVVDVQHDPIDAR